MTRFLDKYSVFGGLLALILVLAGCAGSDSYMKQIQEDRQVISGISTSKTGVSISGTRPFVYLVQREYQDSLPELLVIKLKNTELGKFRQPVTVSDGPVEMVVPYERATGGAWDSEIHLQLRYHSEYKISEEGNNLLIAFGGESGSSPSPVGLKTSPPSATPPVPAAKQDGASRLHPNGYEIGPEDVLEVLVWKNADLSRTVTVRPDGNISLPLIGDVPAAGMTPEALRDEIVRRVSEYQLVPGVSVIVQEVNSYNIYILGEVGKPGKYQLKSNATLLQAISLAGGFTPFASTNDIKVLRKVDGQTQESIFKIRYKDIVSNDDPRKNIVLKPGDTIIVP